MKYLLKATLLIICFTLISFSLQAQNNQYYSIQLGAFQKPNIDAFNSVKDLGSIYQEKTKSGLTRILLGKYTDKTEAQTSLTGAKEKGFASAFLIRRMTKKKPKPTEASNNSTADDTKPDTEEEEDDLQNVNENYDEKPVETKVEETTTPTETAAEQPIPTEQITLPDEVYVVQLAAFKSNVPQKDFEGLSKEASVYKNKEGEWTRVVLGAKHKVEDAKALIETAQKAGYNGAFVKKVASKKLELLFQSEKTPTTPVNQPRKETKPPIDEKEEDLIKVDNDGEDATGDEAEIETIDKRDEVSGEPMPMSEKTEASAIATIDLIDEINCINCNEAEDKITIEGTLYPITEKRLLLEGKMAYEGDMYSQTLLLSSNDGGHSWKQVVPPDFGYEILHLDFIDENIGYLINFWVVEGAGDLKLYKTTDSGETWNFVSAIPKNDFLCLPLITQFTDDRNGLVIYECDVPEPGYYAWSTITGGEKWVSIGSITEDDYQAFVQNAAESKRKKELENEEFTTMIDDSSWKQEMTDDHIILYKANEKGQWEEVSRLLRNYQKVDGKIEILLTSKK